MDLTEASTRRLRLRRGLGLCLAAMAGVARHQHLAVRKFAINLLDHLDHVPRGFLFRILVARHVALHVAVIALRAQPRSEGAHDLHHLRPRSNFQHFEIGWIRLRLCFVLSRQRQPS